MQVILEQYVIVITPDGSPVTKWHLTLCYHLLLVSIQIILSLLACCSQVCDIYYTSMGALVPRMETHVLLAYKIFCLC